LNTHHAAVNQTPVPRLQARDFQRICRLIEHHAGIALGQSKHTMVYARLSKRLRLLGFARFSDYLDWLESGKNADEWQAFINALTTNLTAFFREPHHFQQLRQQLQTSQVNISQPLKLWSCATSTGEEAWSMAITACETFSSFNPPVRILATDVNTHVLHIARHGIYRQERLHGLDEHVRRRYFLRGNNTHDGYYRVRPALQALVEFRPLNLLAARFAVAGPFAALFCRNVMIYFDKATQRTVLSQLLAHMDEHSLLYTGHAENYLHAADLIMPCGRNIYRRTPITA